MASNIDRVNFRIPEKANPNNPAHMTKLLAKLAESKGEGWEMESVDTATATAIRQVQITQISAASANTKKVSLSKDVKPSEGDRWAARLADREGPGWPGMGDDRIQAVPWVRGDDAALGRGILVPQDDGHRLGRQTVGHPGRQATRWRLHHPAT